jgi:esterase/lipase superfamily enzyme
VSLKEGLAARAACGLLLGVTFWMMGCGGGAEMAQAPPDENHAETATATAEAPPEESYAETATETAQSPEPGDPPPDLGPTAASADSPPGDDSSVRLRSIESPAYAPQVRSLEPKPSFPTAEEPSPSAHVVVPVYYATDRLPLGKHLERFDWETFLLPILTVLVTTFFGLATIFSRRRVLWGCFTVFSALVCVQFLQSAVVQDQKEQRWADNGSRSYGSERHETPSGYQMEYGICEVTIPPVHEIGRMEMPSLYRLEFREDPEKHVILDRVTAEPEDAFYEALQERIRQSYDQQAFVFVHGYNVSFEGAVKRTAQIAHDLKFDGAPVCYSWPSKAGLAEYTRDEANVAWTVVHLEDFLNQLVLRSNARTVHLVAHSMGNRALLQALERIALKQSEPEPVFGQLIMAAPDVDTSQFRDRYAPAVSQVVRQMTLYASSNDRALVASTKVHGYTRAGLSGNSLVVVAGIDTVDVSPIDTSLIGHSYYGDNPHLIQDLRALVELSTPASSRPWLERTVSQSNLAYWVFRSDARDLPVNAQRPRTGSFRLR